MTGRSRILLVEDEESLLDAVRMNLEMEGYDVVPATDGQKALEIFDKQRFDLIILDVMLPEVNGFDVCRTIRLSNTTVPILFLSARGADKDRVEGLKTGGDDYLSKPFNLEELLLRVDILISRNKGRSRKSIPDTVAINGIEINFPSFEIITKDGKTVRLSKKEAGLLKLLIEKEGEVVSRDEVLDRIWGYDVYPSTRTIDNYILKFRRIFEEDTRNPKHFHSVRGVGYKLTFQAG